MASKLVAQKRKPLLKAAPQTKELSPLIVLTASICFVAGVLVMHILGKLAGIVRH